MTKVKICGLSRPEDIEAVNAYGADYAGFVFFEKSKRNVSYEKAEMLIKELKKNPKIQSVAVCVSPSQDEVGRFNDMGFDFIQIHGTIPADCQSDGGLALWQAVNIAGSTAENADELFVQSSNIRGYVVDGAEYGSGKTFGIRILHPDVVDVCSGVEGNGVKDADLIRKFISAVKHC